MIAVLMVIAGVGTASDSVYGVVRTAGTGQPVADAQVSVGGPGTTTVTDSTGAYVLRDVPVGRLQVRFQRMGFAPLSVRVMLAPGTAVRLDVDLTILPVPLSPVSVRSAESPSDPVDSIEIGHLHVTPMLADRNPLVGDPDVFAALAASPFIAGRAELAPSLRVRGGAGDQNLVLIDGIPWRGPRPLGGVVGLLPASAVGSVDVHTAAPPARYGDALSSTIVVHPRDVESLTADGRLDGSIAEQTLAGVLPLRGASLLGSARWTYRSIFNPPEGGGENENGFQDIFGRLTLPAGADGGRLHFYYLNTHDDLAFAQSADPATTALNQFKSAGYLTGAVWTRPVTQTGAIHARVWYSEASTVGSWRSATVHSRLGDVGATVDYTDDRTEAGLGVSSSATNYRVRDSSGASFSVNGTPTITSAHLTRRWTPLENWSVSTGLRLTATATWGIRLEPRLATRVALGSGIAASLAYARTHQYLQSARNEESVMDVVLGMDLPITTPPARADQFTAGLEARLGTRSTAMIEAYGRRFAGLTLVPLKTPLPFADGPSPVGRGDAQGVDLVYAYHAPRVDLQGQVSVVQSTRTVGGFTYRTSDDAARAMIGAIYRPARSTSLRLVAAYGDGRPTSVLQDGLQLDPYDPLDGGGALTGSPAASANAINTARLSHYLRVDVGASHEWKRLTVTATVANLFANRNVLAMVSTPTGDQPVFLLARTIGLRARWSLGR